MGDESSVADRGHDEARARVQAYKAEVTRIRADETLSDKGKYDAFESAYDEARATVASILQETEGQTRTRTQELSRALFGLPASAGDATVIAFRDAQDRVGRTKSPEELGELMESAAGAGDQTLLRAGFAYAWQRSRNPLDSDGWGGLLAEYLSEFPQYQDNFRELTQLTSKFGKTESFLRRAMVTPTKPRELRERVRSDPTTDRTDTYS